VRAMNPGAVEEAGVPKEHRPLLPRRFSSVGGAAEHPSFRPRRFCGRWGLVCRRSARRLDEIERKLDRIMEELRTPTAIGYSVRRGNFPKND
jgi:hypothetical protein